MLPPWRRRVLLYRVASALPGAESLLDWYRLHLGGVQRLDLGQRTNELREMVHMLRMAGATVQGKDLVEIGAGWHPILPALLFGMGARSIVMTDLTRHMTGPLVDATIKYLLANSQEFADVAGCSEGTMHRRWSALLPGHRRWTDVWQSQGITYRAPLDFVRGRLPLESADLVFSNSCLNYVPAPVLRGVMTASLRLLRPGGFIAHNIHVYDDLAGHDPSIRPWNFLCYSEEEWQRLGNCRAHYQNRLRPRDYAELATGTGMVVLYDERVPLETSPADRDRLALHPDFRRLPIDEINCSHYLLVATKPDARSTLPGRCHKPDDSRRDGTRPSLYSGGAARRVGRRNGDSSGCLPRGHHLRTVRVLAVTDRQLAAKPTTLERMPLRRREDSNALLGHYVVQQGGHWNEPAILAGQTFHKASESWMQVVAF